LQNTDYLYSIDHNIGVVGENGFTEQDCIDAGGTVEDGSTAHPHSGVCNGPPAIIFSSHGGKGSAVIESNNALSLISDGGACVTDSSGDPALYGPDGIACTDDDPGQAEPVMLTNTSGTAVAQLLDAGNDSGSVIGPDAQCGALPCQAQITGSRVSCGDLTEGAFSATMVSASSFIDSQSIGDNVVTTEVICSAPVTPTATATLVPTAKPTPTLTASFTPVPTSTPTATASPSPTPSATPSSSPTQTPTATPQPGGGGGCTVTPNDIAVAWWLLVPVFMLVWARRQKWG